VLWQSEERGIGFCGGRRCEELFVVFIFLWYQQKPANPILTTRWICRVINCSIAFGSLMKPAGLMVDVQRLIFVPPPAFEFVHYSKDINGAFRSGLFPVFQKRGIFISLKNSG
jgi:hypothetical protein